jgi:hypothetical protein
LNIAIESPPARIMSIYNLLGMILVGFLTTNCTKHSLLLVVLQLKLAAGYEFYVAARKTLYSNIHRKSTIGKTVFTYRIILGGIHPLIKIKSLLLALITLPPGTFCE